MNVSTKKQRGFTIIEVVLVLAIAGLIFLIVFLALPALQRTQRDQQRRSDVGRIIAATQSFQANNSGTLPFTIAASGEWTATNATLVTSYMDGRFNDPTTNAAYAIGNSTATLGVATGNVQLKVHRGTCNAGGTSTLATTGKLVFVMYLEQGGQMCQTI